MMPPEFQLIAQIHDLSQLRHQNIKEVTLV